MSKSKSRYVPALDGLRALAVLSVIAYHMSLGWAPGGLLGVTMFFVLSGYLITGLLLKEYDDSGTISLSNFWLRRVRRIIPAVVFGVLGTALLCAIFDHALLTKLRPDVLPTLFFVNNWWQIFNNVSYFDALGEPSPLTHYWSLSIEEQFYLIWPLALLACMKFGVRKPTMQKGIIVLIVLSAVEMALLFDPHADPSRVYYGTDTRAFSLLIGSLLAFIWPYQKLTKRAGARMSSQGRLIFNVVGVVAVLGLIVMVIVTNGFAPFIYRGGLVLCSLLTAVAIAVMVHPISLIGRFFALKPLVWIGKVSYSMYLWHFPIILLMTPNNMVGDVPWWLRILQLVVIFAISAFSYYIVENPIRHGAIGQFISDWRAGEFTLADWARTHFVPTAVCIVFFLGSIGGIAFVPDTSSVAELNGMQNTITSKIIRAGSAAKVKAEAEMDARRPDILLIGDSVPQGMEGYGVFSQVFPYGMIDAQVSRQFYTAPEIYADYRDKNLVGKVLVIALGTNGYTTDEETEALMKEIGNDQLVWFVNTRSPEEYMAESNAAIQRCVDKYDNAELIDWYSISADHPEYFDGDGTHLTPESAEIYAWMIHDAVSDYLRPVTSSAREAASENANSSSSAASADADEAGSSAGADSSTATGASSGDGETDTSSQNGESTE